MKVAILGNGSIGSMLALKISNSGHSVTIFGDKFRKGSASIAAGAMLNVMAEVEDGQLDYEPLRLKFELAYNSQRKWDDFVSKNFSSSENIEFKKRNTIILTNHRTTPFEKKQFNYLKKIKKDFPKDIKIKISSNKNDVILPRERFIDSNLLMNTLDKHLQKNKVKCINDIKDYQLRKINKKIQITFNKKKETFDFVVVALGSFTEKFNTRNKKLIGKIPRIFYGVGSAFSVIKKNFTKDFKPSRSVLRTMNRGSACGFHLIPISKKEFYFGASNSVTQIQEKYPRIGSVAVLTNGLINEFNKELKDNYLQIRFGYRPISADTFPILGPLDNHPQIIYATGNKRDGLTCSLEISQLIDQYINGDKYAFDKYKLFKPNRNLISYYDRNTAILKSAETIVAGKMMHNEYTKSQDWEKLVKREINQIKKLYSNLKSKSFGIHPELINMYKYKRI